jgi:hypothetical protein
MNGTNLKSLVIAILLVNAVTLGACGGGDNRSTPVAEVVTVKKGIVRGSNAALREVEQVAFQAIKILEVRCAFLFPPPSSFVTSQSPAFTLLLDLYADDVEKTKAYGFTLFTSEEKARNEGAVCT